MKTILVLQGPNLNLLGQREPEKYGSKSLEAIQRDLDVVAESLGVQLRHLQSNHEGELIDAVHQAQRDGVSGAVVNAAAYTHTSVGLRDAFLATDLPFVEVHISNVYAREAFRHHSYLSDISLGMLTGFGPQGYELALRGLVARLAVVIP